MSACGRTRRSSTSASNECHPTSTCRITITITCIFITSIMAIIATISSTITWGSTWSTITCATTTIMTRVATRFTTISRTITSTTYIIAYIITCRITTTYWTTCTTPVNTCWCCTTVWWSWKTRNKITIRTTWVRRNIKKESGRNKPPWFYIIYWISSIACLRGSVNLLISS